MKPVTIEGMDQLAAMLAIVAIIVLLVCSGLLLDSNLRARRWGVDGFFEWAVLGVFVLLALALAAWLIWFGPWASCG